MSDFRPTIAIDFDGVIHKYSRGYDDGSCYDEEMEGAYDGLKKLLEDYRVFVFSTRNPLQIINWFDAHMPLFKVERIPESEKFWNKDGVIGVTQRKLPALMYIDDRAHRFRSWSNVLKATANPKDL